MNKILHILLFLSCYSYGQSDRVKEFYPLKSIDTVSDIEVLKKLSRIDSLNSKDYFFTDEYNEETGFFLVKCNELDWTIFDFDSFINNVSNTHVSQIKKENERFISIQSYRSPSGGCATSYGILFLLDIENLKRIDFSNYNMEECYNDKGEVSYHAECKATIKIEGEIIRVVSTKKPDDGLICIESSKYRIQENRLFKL